jgi:hypothetical protein
MDPFLFRIIRSFIMAIIMFFSVKSFGLSAGAATIASFVPLLLGIVDVMAPTAYGITAIIFILAVIVHVFPEQYESLKKMTGEGLTEVHASPKPQSALPSTDPTNTSAPKQ